jgi:hypothetical protein
MQTTNRRSLLVAAAIAALAMIPAGASATPDNPDATVLVRNYNSLDVQVFAVTEAGKRFELGTVNRGAERSFVLPDRLMEGGMPFRLKIYSLARATPASVIDNHVAGVKTQLLSPTDGEQILLNVKSPLITSFIDRGTAMP